MEKIEFGKGKRTKLGQILQTLARSRSISSVKRSSGIPSGPMSKSKSWPRATNTGNDKHCPKHRVAPEGCFSVYVGPEKERFVIKTEYANHPLFKMLLEEAEMEYGYNSCGPLALPCGVDIFHKVLCEMDSDEIPSGCNFTKGYAGYQLLSPSRAGAAMH
ncbi:auxin-responsive protein SAUR72 [Magnolia sinica]|uniref:auxin-responsive protein SAUR72 n=1 Tax=Magnolia sinica TaxID=86752 RepID=UPI002659C58E|nr:auxin-responsive protein SAUR72 [Magnolia sinica]